MDLHRFVIQFLVVAGAIALTALIVVQPDLLTDDILDLVKYGLTSLWTLVAVIVRDTRNRVTKDDNLRRDA